MRTIQRSGILVVAALAALLVGCGGGGGGGGTDPGDPVDQALFEDFLDTANQDVLATNADWGGESSILKSGPTTSRNAYAYCYPETDNGVNSGRGQYVEFTTPLTGVDLAVSPPTPPVAQGRRVQWSFSDTLIGDAGTITAVAWGPVENTTVAAIYPNVRLRMGYQAAGSTSLGSSISGNYAGTPVLVYDGTYQVQATANVGNTAGEPETAHVGSYPQGTGCTGAAGAPGGHNAGLFAYTGWYGWPALTTPFEWDPGDPLVAGDSTLLFDASVGVGDFTQRMRGWFAVTYPCSGILIAGRPETRVVSTYEGDAPDPADNFVAGVVNPEPSAVDMCFTLTQALSVGQSLFLEGAFGDDTDYGSPTVLPETQSGNAVVALAFQGADAIEADRRTLDVTQPHTGWVSSIHACDGMRYLRFRFTLTPDPVTLEAARIDSIRIPMTDMNP